MTSTIRALAVAVAAYAFSICSVAQQAAPTQTFLKEAKITVNNGVDEVGFLMVRVQPENGQALEATVPLTKSMSENDIARGIADALTPVLAPNYKADKDGGEHVKISKAQNSAANFSVAVMFNAPGFSIIIDK
jgi:hypothetical protein